VTPVCPAVVGFAVATLFDEAEHTSTGMVHNVDTARAGPLARRVVGSVTGVAAPARIGGRPSRVGA